MCSVLQLPTHNLHSFPCLTSHGLIHTATHILDGLQRSYCATVQCASAVSHTVTSGGRNGCCLSPLGWLGALVGRWHVNPSCSMCGRSVRLDQEGHHKSLREEAGSGCEYWRCVCTIVVDGRSKSSQSLAVASYLECKYAVLLLRMLFSRVIEW